MFILHRISTVIETKSMHLVTERNTSEQTLSKSIDQYYINTHLQHSLSPLFLANIFILIKTRSSN